MLVVFDCFETLVKSTASAPRPEHWASLFARHLGISSVRAQRAIYPMINSCLSYGQINMSTEHVLRRTLCRGSDTPSMAEALSALWVAAGNADGRYIAADGARGLLEHLVASGHTVRLLSNCILTRGQMARLLRELDLLKPFDEMHLSSEGVGKKPDLAFFARAARGVWEEVVMVGDSYEIDIAPADRLGWHTVNVSTEANPWHAVVRRIDGISSSDGSSLSKGFLWN